MARAHLYYVVTDRSRNVNQNDSVDVYQIGTTTPVATAGMYTTRTGGTNATNPLISDERGVIEAWLTTAQTVELRVTDNSDTAYLPNDPSQLKTWTPFTVTREVHVAPED